LGWALAALPSFSVYAGPPDRAFDGALNATYRIEKQAFRLIDGRSEVQAAPSIAKTMYLRLNEGRLKRGSLKGDCFCPMSGRFSP